VVNSLLRRFVPLALATFLLLIMLMMLLAFLNIDFRSTLPRAQNGVLQLEHLLESGQTIPLDGEWHFYPHQFLSLQEINAPSGHDPMTMEAPSSWGDRVSTDGVQGNGYGTYHLRVTMAEPPDILSLKLPSAGTSYRLYVDGELITEVGQAAISKELSSPLFRPQVLVFKPKSNQFDLTLQMANFSYRWGGLWFSISLGLPSSINKDQTNKHMGAAFSSGFLLAVAISSIFLYLLRRREPLPFYFALLCVTNGIRELAIDDIIILSLLPQLTFLAIVKIQYLTVYVSTLAITQIMNLSFTGVASKFSITFILYFCAVYCLALFVLPIDFMSHCHVLFEIFGLLVLLFLIGLAIKAWLLSKASAGLTIFGLFILALTAINDVLYANELSPLGYMANFGLIIFVLTQVYVGNRRFTRTLHVAEILSSELEQKVSDRTRELEHAYSQLEHMASSDALTGILNRHGLLPLIEQEQSQFERYATAYSILLIDLDHFKGVNDQYGHEMGDTVLVECSTAITSAIRASDCAGRWGGEEFVILLPNTTLQDAIVAAEKIRTLIEALIIKQGDLSVKFTATVGVAEINQEESFDQCLARADSLLYQGKEQGRNRVVWKGP